MTADTSGSPAAAPADMDDTDPTVSSDRLRLRYMLAAAHTHSALTSTRSLPALKRAQQHTATAVKDAGPLLRDLNAFLSPPDNLIGKLARARWFLPGATRRKSSEDDRAARDRAFLTEVFIPTAEVLLAGVQAEVLYRGYGSEWHGGPLPELSKLREQVTCIERCACEKPERRYRVLYNVACFWSEQHRHETSGSLVNAPPPRKPARPGYDDMALAALLSALRAAPRDEQRKMAAWARSDPSLKALREGGLKATVAAMLDLYAPISPRAAAPTSPRKEAPAPVD